MQRPALTALVLVALACSKAPPPGEGAVVARVGKTELREEDLRRAMERDPGAAPRRFDGPEAKQELLEGLIRFELLAQAAERAGLTKDPDAVHAMKQIAVTKLVNRELGVAASPSSITREELEREYRARQATDYTLPPAARVRHIRVSSATLAAELAGRARSLGADDDRGFAALAAEHSEDVATRTSGGDLGFVSRGSPLPGPVVDAALSLRAPGEVVGPVETSEGFELVRLVERRAAAVSPLSSVEEPLRQRMYRERRAAALEALISRLRQETVVELTDAERNRR